jgi:CDP-diacylglycerol--glycerol-3-phosphate 3-phosphatidyltransferase
MVPLVMASWFSHQYTVCVSTFIVASITDFLDGYLARKLNVSTKFGAFLDPVADKLMVATVLVLLSTFPVSNGIFQSCAVWLLPTLSIVIISREIMISALREWTASLGPEAHRITAVSGTGKWKTATQMVALTLLLLEKAIIASFSNTQLAELLGSAGTIFLILAAMLTVWSLFQYFNEVWNYMRLE